MNLAVSIEILDPTSVDVGRALVCTNPNVGIWQTPQLSWRLWISRRKLEAALSDQTLAARLTLLGWGQVRARRSHIGGMTPLPTVTRSAWSPGLVLIITVDPMAAADRSAST